MSPEAPTKPDRHEVQAERDPTRLPGLQRTTGTLRVMFKRTERGTVLDTFFQEGAARARLPRVPRGSDPEAILINTAGGLTGGDRFHTEVVARPDTSAVVTTQASEKIYRASEGSTVITNRIEIGEEARLEWLPQETIVFDGSSLDRTLEVSMELSSEALLAEAVVFGRTAMGESVRRAKFLDRWRVRRAGQLIFADGTTVGPDVQADMGRSLALNGGCGFATVLWIASDAERLLEPVRRALGIGRVDPNDPGSEPGPDGVPGAFAGVSAWDGMLAVRVVATDGAPLRAALERTLQALRQGRPLPTVWRC